MIRYAERWTPALPSVFGIRFTPDKVQTAPRTIPHITLQLVSHNGIPPHSAAIPYGPIATEKLTVRGPGTGFRKSPYRADLIHSADVEFPRLPGNPLVARAQLLER